MVKPIQFSVVLAAGLALAGCAHQRAATGHATTDVVVTKIAVSADASDAGQSALPDNLATQGASLDPAPNAAMLPADLASLSDRSLVAAPPPDLFIRLRSGFQLEDADASIIDRELNWYANNPAYLERVWGRAEHYLHFIVEQLTARKMPAELALLPVVESAFEPYAYSHARASGLWQFIPGTGSNYGLKQDWWYDGRRDVVASTRAALDYLQALHSSFDGDWLLAIAAYNCGAGNVQRAVRRNQRAGRPIDFWHLKLPRETRAYVPKLLAMRRIVADPALFGLEFSQIPDAPYFVQVATGGQIDLQVAAELSGLTKNDLYELNPAFHRWATDPTGPYSLLVPAEAAEGLEQTLLSLSPEQRMRVARYAVKPSDTVAAIASQFNTTPELLRHLNNMETTDKLVVGNTLMVPSSAIQLPEKAMRAAALFDSPVRMHGRRLARHGLHVVRRGDTLYGLAHRLHTDVRTLARLNHMNVSDRLRAGQHLVVSDRAPRLGGGVISAGANSSGQPAKAGLASSSAGSGRQVTYTVRHGDTLYGIAKVLQVSVRELLGWNSISTSNALHPGQKLVAFVSRHS